MTLLKKLEHAEEEYTRKVRSIKEMYKVKAFLEGAINDPEVKVSTYTWGTYYDVDISAPSIEAAELNVIPAISELFGGGMWTKEVDEERVCYRYNKRLLTEIAYITVSFRFNDSCDIKLIPTGRTIRKHKSVEIEEPEFEYVVDCG